jgi:hypothetical protein
MCRMGGPTDTIIPFVCHFFALVLRPFCSGPDSDKMSFRPNGDIATASVASARP